MTNELHDLTTTDIHLLEESLRHNFGVELENDVLLSEQADWFEELSKRRGYCIERCETYATIARIIREAQSLGVTDDDFAKYHADC